jgi:hypothetical protein
MEREYIMNNSEQTYTMKQIADKAGIDKTKVWRYIRSANIHETSHKGRTLLFSEQQVNSILKALNGTNAHSENVTSEHLTDDQPDMIKLLKSQLETLNSELEQKNNEINQLHRLLDQQQQLNLSTQKLLEKQPPEVKSESLKDDSNIITPESSKNSSEAKNSANNASWLKRLFRK